MKSFDLLRPRNLEEALGALAPREAGGAAVMPLAGGQDLLTELAEHLVAADTLVELSGVEELGHLAPTADGGFELGALVTLRQLAEDERIAGSYPLLAEAALAVGSPQIRSVGTLGGNLNQRPRCWYYRNELAPCLKKGGDECFAESGKSKYNAILGGGPSYIVHPSDLAPALVALDATAHLAGPDGERDVPLAEYYTLPDEGDVTRETVLRPGELLTRVALPAPAAFAGPGSEVRGTFLKFRERESYDFALSAVALLLARAGRRVTGVRLVLGGVAPKPWRAHAAEKLLLGSELEPEVVQRAAEAAVEGAEPLADNAFKLPLTRALVTQALQKLGT